MTTPQRLILALGILCLIALLICGNLTVHVQYNGGWHYRSPNWSDWLCTLIKCIIVSMITLFSVRLMERKK